MKKTLSLFLAVMISAAALAGCTENGNNGTETGTQQTTEDQTTEIGKDTTGDTTVEYNHTPDLPRNVYSVYEENVRHTIDEEVLEMGTTLPDATYDNLPKWYGFNLTNKFSGRNYSFVEEDFKTISEMGYNYVRLPMDYQMWIYKGNWEHINNTVMKDIDKAVEYGIKYNIHVDINFHRAPGFTVASPAERTSLWTDEETQQVFAAHWRMFALRYKDIPSSVLSFNLVNEPAGVSSSEYARIMGIAIDAIREVDPDRLIIADGLGGNKPVPELVPYKVAQSVHSYQPHSITHYMSTWSAEATMYPEPEWPLTYSVVSYLYGNGKSQWQTPLVIEGNFDEGEISITVGQVSSYINLIIKADDKVIMNAVASYEASSFDSSVFEDAYNFNTSLIPVNGCLKLTELPALASDNAYISSVKPSIDGQGIVVRIAEYRGMASEPEITLPSWASSVSSVNMLERDEKTLDISGGNAQFELRPFEIKTLLFKMK